MKTLNLEQMEVTYGGITMTGSSSITDIDAISAHNKCVLIGCGSIVLMTALVACGPIGWAGLIGYTGGMGFSIWGLQDCL
jgi:hypothetical protein